MANRLELSLAAVFATLRGEVMPQAPVRGRWVMGRRVPPDFIWTTLGVPFIVSDKVVSILEAHAFTGWATYPVEIRDHTGEVIAGYHGLSVRGRCGPLQPERSVVIRKRGPVGNLIDVYQGKFFDETAWDGSALLMPAGRTGLVFVVEAVRNALAAAKVKGIELDRADTHERLVR